MILDKRRRSKFKQELLPILYLSIMQVLWSFNHPVLKRLDGFWNTLFSVVLSIVGILGIVITFTFADILAPQFNLEYLDEMPYSHILKNIQKTVLIFIFHMTIFWMWYKKILNLPDIYYVFCYVHFIIAFALLIRAIKRPQDDV